MDKDTHWKQIINICNEQTEKPKWWADGGTKAILCTIFIYKFISHFLAEKNTPTKKKNAF